MKILFCKQYIVNYSKKINILLKICKQLSYTQSRKILKISWERTLGSDHPQSWDKPRATWRIHTESCMASGARRRKNNTPNNNHQRSNLNTLSKSMSKSISSSSLFTSFKIYLLYIPLIIMILAAFFLLSIPSNTFSAIGSKTNSPQNYVIEVVNEFPHDPKAFTQVGLRTWFEFIRKWLFRCRSL